MFSGVLRLSMGVRGAVSRGFIVRGAVSRGSIVRGTVSRGSIAVSRVRGAVSRGSIVRGEYWVLISRGMYLLTQEQDEVG